MLLDRGFSALWAGIIRGDTMDFTSKMKLFEVLENIRTAFPDYADALGAEYTDETMLVRKAGASETLEVQPVTQNAATGKDEGIIIGDITTLSVDSYNEVVLPEGMDKTRYDKNRVVLRAHNYIDFLPHAENAWLKAYPTNAPTRIRAATKYYLDDDYGLKVYKHRSAKRPLGYSIGFIPTKVAFGDSEDWGDQVEMWQDRYSKHTGGSVARADMPTPDMIYLNWQLLEYSDVVVPANPDTVASYVAKGLIPPEKAAEYTIEGAEDPPADDSDEKLAQIIEALKESPDLAAYFKSLVEPEPEPQVDIMAAVAEAMENVPELKEITIPERTAFKDFSISSVIAKAQGALE